MKYYIVKNKNEILDEFPSFELAQDALKEWFIIDSEAAFENGLFIADDNGVLIKSDDDGKLYTQSNISEMESWNGGEYVFDEDFCEYKDAERNLLEIVNE